MMQTTDLADEIMKMALSLLRRMPQPEEKHFRAAVKSAATSVLEFRAMMGEELGTVDQEAIFRDLQTLHSVYTPNGTILTDKTGHEVWLPDKRSKIDWDFWRRYQLYLEQEKKLPPKVVDRLDSLTDRILENLEDPERTSEWDRRGMVVGQVQSGKTANYTGLICKAADAGYKLIVVLAGIHNSLRSQTQLRLDEGFLGRDTKLERAFKKDSGQMGVGYVLLDSGRTPIAHSLTTSAENGDFSKSVAESLAIHVGKDPVLLVIKKNGPVLNNLLTWVRGHLGKTVTADGVVKKIVANVPLLLLDDEADNASINTAKLEEDEKGRFKKDKQKLTRINKLIRELLDAFHKSAYVGYTATPFANIFIPPDASTKEEGADLFPRSFIINLPAPTNYIGPVQVFGLDAPDSETQAGLPIVRSVLDADDELPPSHKQDLRPNALPDSLKEALRAFVLVCAARRARGQATEHNSMLIHVTRFINVQREVRELVEQEIKRLQRRLQYGDGNLQPTLRQELKALWESEFVPKTQRIMKLLPDDAKIQLLNWQHVESNLIEAALKIAVKEINGTAKDVLDYYDNPQGLSVVAIGGDKLSRGLTLEGLSVSYYLRASRMYDTLMQMGRWFGYRPGYADLCRLYTTPELINWYEHITFASEELRQAFDRMVAAGMTPEEFGHKVRTHPGGLAVTSAGKMRYGKVVRVSFSGELIESYRLEKSAKIIGGNYARISEFLNGLYIPHRQPTDDWRSDCKWDDVSGQNVIDYLLKLQGHPGVPAADPLKLAEFIGKKLMIGELVKWTVVLISSSQGRQAQVGNYEVGLTVRNPANPDDKGTYSIRNRHIMSMNDEMLDLSDAEKKKAYEKTVSSWQITQKTPNKPKEPSGPFIREARPAERGLLLLYPLDSHKVFAPDEPQYSGCPIIGFAISFPSTNHPEDAVEYLANMTYWKEEIEALKQEEEEMLKDAA